MARTVEPASGPARPHDEARRPDAGIDASAACEVSVTAPASEAARNADLISIHPGGSRPPLFLIQTWGDEIPHLQRLAAHLGPDQPIFSVNAPRGERREDFPRRAEHWADYCLERFDRLQWRGAWRVGGWSFGGVLALTVAERLIARGAEVPLVLLLDSLLPRPSRKPEARRAHSLGQRLAETAHGYYQQPPEARGAHLKKVLLGWRRGFLARIGRGHQQWVAERKRSMGLLQRAIHVAYLNFTPCVSHAPVWLLWSDESLADRNDAGLGWHRHLRGPFVSMRAGAGHFSIWSEPEVARLAELTAEALRWSAEWRPLASDVSDP